MGNTLITADNDVLYTTDSSQNTDSLSSYEILCIDEARISQETDEESYEERNSITHQSSRNIIQISDPWERCAELEKNVAAVKRLILNPLTEEIAVIGKTKNNIKPELEIVLNENASSDSLQQECVIKSCFRDLEQVGRRAKREPPRFHSMLVDPSLHLQVSDELYGLRMSLEERSQWKFCYAYHLERFRQLHSMIVKDYQMKLEELELHRCKLERYAHNTKRDNDFIRNIVVDCNNKIDEVEKEAERVAKENQEQLEKMNRTHQANVLKFQRRLKTSYNYQKELKEQKKTIDVERLSEIASLREEIAGLKRRMEVKDINNRAYRTMAQAQLEEYITLSKIQSEELDYLRNSNDLLKQETKSLEFDVQSARWASRLQEDLASADMLSTQHRFRKEVIDKLSGDLVGKSSERIESKKTAYERLKKCTALSSQEGENSRSTPRDNVKCQDKTLQSAVKQVQKETIGTVRTKIYRNRDMMLYDNSTSVVSRDIKFIQNENTDEKETIDKVRTINSSKKEESNEEKSRRQNIDVMLLDNSGDEGTCCVEARISSFDSTISVVESTILSKHARNKSPTVVYKDEFDSLFMARDKAASSASIPPLETSSNNKSLVISDEARTTMATVEVSESGVEVSDANQIASNSHDSSVTSREEVYANPTSSANDADTQCKEFSTPFVINQQADYFLSPVIIDQREIFEFPGFSGPTRQESSDTGSTYSDFGIEVTAVVYTWDGQEKHIPLILEPSNGCNKSRFDDERGDDQFYVSSIEPSESENEMTLSISEDISKKSVESHPIIEKLDTGKTDDLTKSPESLYVTEEYQTYTSVSLKNFIEAYSDKVNYITSESAVEETTSSSTVANEESVEITRLNYETELAIGEAGKRVDGEEGEFCTQVQEARDDSNSCDITTVDEIDFFKPDARDDDSNKDCFAGKDNIISFPRETFDFSLRNQNTFEFSYSPIEFGDDENVFKSGISDKKDESNFATGPDLYEL